MTSIDHEHTDKPQMGGRIRRLRRQQSLSQAKLAAELGISASYLNLIEHNRRNVTVPLLMKLTKRFELELSDIADGDETHLHGDLMEVFRDELFRKLNLTDLDVRDLVTWNATVARAVLVLYESYQNQKTNTDIILAESSGSDRSPDEQVTDFFQTHADHFPELVAAAERVNEDASLSGEEPLLAMTSFLANTFDVRVSNLPATRAPLARRLYTDKWGLDPSNPLHADGRNFETAHQIGLLAAERELNKLIEEGDFTNDEACKLARVALADYFAAVLLRRLQKGYKSRAQDV